MALSELAKYRLATVQRLANQTVDSAIEAEQQRAAQEQTRLRRTAVARVLGGFNSGGTREEMGRSAMSTITGLLPYGAEGKAAAEGVSKGIESYSRLNPMFRPPEPRTPAAVKPSEDWLDATQSPSKEYPLTKRFGQDIHKLVRKHENNIPTGMYKYVPAGNISAGGGSGAVTEKNIEKYRDQFIKANEAVNQTENYYGRGNLDAWREELKSDPDYAQMMNKPEGLMELAFQGMDKTKAMKVRGLLQYEKNLALKQATEKLANGLGYAFDQDTGEITKVDPRAMKERGAKTLNQPKIPPLLARPTPSTSPNAGSKRTIPGF